MHQRLRRRRQRSSRPSLNLKLNLKLRLGQRLLLLLPPSLPSKVTARIAPLALPRRLSPRRRRYASCFRLPSLLGADLGLRLQEKAFALLPQHGSQFTSPEQFYAACLKSSLEAFGVPTWKNSDSTSTLRAECSLRKSQKCHFSIAAVRSEGKWVVSKEKSRLEHNHAWRKKQVESEDEDPDGELFSVYLAETKT